MFPSLRLFTILILMTSTIGLCACETMYGAGRDVENAGEAVQDAAK